MPGLRKEELRQWQGVLIASSVTAFPTHSTSSSLSPFFFSDTHLLLRHGAFQCQVTVHTHTYCTHTQTHTHTHRVRRRKSRHIDFVDMLGSTEGIVQPRMTFLYLIDMVWVAISDSMLMPSFPFHHSTAISPSPVIHITLTWRTVNLF